MSSTPNSTVTAAVRRWAEVAAAALLTLATGCGSDAPVADVCDQPTSLWTVRSDEGADERGTAVLPLGKGVAVGGVRLAAGSGEAFVQQFGVDGSTGTRAKLGESATGPLLLAHAGGVAATYGGFTIVLLDANLNETARLQHGAQLGSGQATVLGLAAGHGGLGLTGSLIVESKGNKAQYVAFVATDGAGIRQHAETFAIDARSEARALLADGEGWVLAGWREAVIADDGRQGLILALDDKGIERWRQVVGGPLDDELEAIVASGAGMLAAGTSRSGGAQGFGGADAWLLRLDAEGNTLWQRFHGGESEDAAYGLIADGAQFVLVGRRHSTDLDPGGAWLAGLDAEGALRWQATLDGHWKAELRAVALDGKRLLAAGSSQAVSDDGSSDLLLQRAADDGRLQCGATP